MMYSEKIEALISAALTDGVLTEKEKQILFKKAQAEGIDLDEFEMVLDARLVELEKAEKEKAAASAPKSTKYGDVRKCPVCGAMVPALAGTCPECGYEFSGVDANLSSRKLAEQIDLIIKESEEKKLEIQKEGKLSRIKEKGASRSPMEEALYQISKNKDERIEKAIKHFSIPNTKSDLFEFITSLQAKVKQEDRFEAAYTTKLNEACDKAKLLFPSESIFEKIINEVILEQQQKKKKNRRMMAFVFLFNILMVIGLVLIFGGGDIKDDYYSAKVTKCIKAGNIEKAIIYTNERPCVKTTRILVPVLVSNGEIDKAVEIYLLADKKDAYIEEAELICNALIAAHRFDDAMEFTNRYTCGTAIQNIVKLLCKEHKKAEAKKFVKLYGDRIHSYSDGTTDDNLRNNSKETPQDIVRKINRYIDNY